MLMCVRDTNIIQIRKVAILIFSTYPDIVTVEQIMEMLNLGKTKVYNLLKDNSIRHLRVGNKYIIPKKSVIDLFDNLWHNDCQAINGKLNQVTKGDIVQ